MSEPAGFIDEPPPRRRSEAFAPLDVWRRTLLFTLLATVLAGAWAAFVHTPMPVEVDTPLYAEQLAKLDRQAAAVRKSGGKPLSVVLLGTSRMRNVALDSKGMAEQARIAGVERPVISTVLGVNWGGFERFAPALALIEQRKPDVLVVMPELLVEDFTPGTRVGVGKAWIESKLWGTAFSPFAVNETTRLVCLGFDQSAEQRDEEAGAMVVNNPDGRGPAMARAFLKKMASAGTRILIADVPVSQHLASLRPPPEHGRALIDKLGIGELRGVEAVVIGASLDQAAYCDVAHLDPKHDHLWQAAFFARSAHVLNGLR